MDDIRICSNQNLTRDKISFKIHMIQSVTPIYAKKVLERRYVNKLYGNLYVTGIDQVQLGSMISQHPNDNSFIIDVSFSLVGVIYFKGMKLAFHIDHMINVNGVVYFQKGNVFALVNGLIINEAESSINSVKSPLIVVKVTVEPNYYPESNLLRVGLICELDRIFESTPELRDAYNA
mgnify:CR=1 FL=1